MTKTHRKAATSTGESFDKHYAAIWGEERWETTLKPALLKPTRYACLINRYARREVAEARIDSANVKLERMALDLPLLKWKDAALIQPGDMLRNCFVRRARPEESSQSPVLPDEPFPAPEPVPDIQTHWNLDAASVLVAHLLNVEPGDNVLDLCAAPGGKSIALSQNIWPELHPDAASQGYGDRVLQRHNASGRGTLHSNEADGPRQRRLAENLKAYLPGSIVEGRNAVALRVDGTSQKSEHELRVRTASRTVGYDKVLVDAPCSSERHILHAHTRAKAGGRAAEEMTNWRPGSSKRLAETQLKLLMMGLKAAKIRGTVMYATCSIEPTENDNVIEKMLAQVEKDRKKGTKWSVKVGFNAGAGDEAVEVELEKSWAERTKHGWMVLPDHPSGGRWGPLYFSLLTKIGD